MLTLVILALGSAASEIFGRVRHAPAPTASVFMKDLRCMTNSFLVFQRWRD